MGMRLTGYSYLPDAYPGHKHATERARRIARDGLIMMAEVGSGVHGLALDSASDDTDYMGLTVEPPECITGLETFEQFQRHTAWDRPQGVAERSGRGDEDYLVYGIQKFCRLALAGNPSLLNLLFVPDNAIATDTPFAQELRANASWFVSKQAAGRYLGYLHRQRLGMTGEAGAKVKRPELVEKHGFDVKYASHALRLGYQGIELLTTGHITLPMPVDQRELVLAVKRGEFPLITVTKMVAAVERQLEVVAEYSPLAEHPDRSAVNRWLHGVYHQVWV